jgi:aryl-alcohol dehydrogenase-like predicted oxidoreductase
MVSSDNTIITKLTSIKGYESMNEKELIQSVESSINASQHHLKRTKLDVVLLHDVTHYYNKIIWNRLLEYKKNNIIMKLGVSVYRLNEVIDICDDHNIQYIQLPFNLFSSEWLNNTFQQKIKQRTDLIIHCRSIFLQGLIVSDKKYWQKISNLDNNVIDLYINQLNNLVVSCDVVNKIELAISYVKAMKWINGIVFGVDNINQLKTNIDLLNNVKSMNSDNVKIVQRLFCDMPSELLDPRKWNVVK